MPPPHRPRHGPIAPGAATLSFRGVAGADTSCTAALQGVSAAEMPVWLVAEALDRDPGRFSMSAGFYDFLWGLSWSCVIIGCHPATPPHCCPTCAEPSQLSVSQRQHYFKRLLDAV